MFLLLIFSFFPLFYSLFFPLYKVINAVFFLAFHCLDCYTIVMSKKYFMLRCSNDVSSLRIYSWLPDGACEQCGSLFQHAIIITVDVTVV